MRSLSSYSFRRPPPVDVWSNASGIRSSYAAWPPFMNIDTASLKCPVRRKSADFLLRVHSLGYLRRHLPRTTYCLGSILWSGSY